MKKRISIVTSIDVNDSYIAERIEEKVTRIIHNKEPISDGAPLIFTDRKDGVRPEFDIRTDRWEIATDAMHEVSQRKLTARKEKMAKGEEAKVVNLPKAGEGSTGETQ